MKRLVPLVLFAELPAVIIMLFPRVQFAQSSTPKTTALTMDAVMSRHELGETGVAGLSPSQRKALDEWLNLYTERVARAVMALAATPLRPHSAPSTNLTPARDCSPAIETQIDGDFNGWDGDTIFKLQNGQIWEQVEYDYEYEYDFMPGVTIYSANDGCRMNVDGMDDTILVKRIK